MSSNMCLSHIVSLVVNAIAMLSVPADECATIACFFNVQEKIPKLSVKVHLEVLLMLSTKYTQWLFVYPNSFEVEVGLYYILLFLVST